MWLRSEYNIPGFVMVNGSPVCGLNRTASPKGEDRMWGGMTWYIPEQEFAEARGVFVSSYRANSKSKG